MFRNTALTDHSEQNTELVATPEYGTCFRKLRFLFDNPVFLKGLFVIFFVAFLLTIFELIFFIYLIEPVESYYIKTFLKSIGKQNFRNDFRNEIRTETTIKYLKILNERELILNNTINSNSILVIILMIVFLFIFLLYLFYRLKYIVKNMYESSQNYNILPSIISGFLTLGIIGLFQVLVFNFGLAFKYTTTDEIYLLITT